MDRARRAQGVRVGGRNQRIPREPAPGPAHQGIRLGMDHTPRTRHAGRHPGGRRRPARADRRVQRPPQPDPGQGRPAGPAGGTADRTQGRAPPPRADRPRGMAGNPESQTEDPAVTRRETPPLVRQARPGRARHPDRHDAARRERAPRPADHRGRRGPGGRRAPADRPARRPRADPRRGRRMARHERRTRHGSRRPDAHHMEGDQHPRRIPTPAAHRPPRPHATAHGMQRDRGRDDQPMRQTHADPLPPARRGGRGPDHRPARRAHRVRRPGTRQVHHPGHPRRRTAHDRRVRPAPGRRIRARRRKGMAHGMEPRNRTTRRTPPWRPTSSTPPHTRWRTRGWPARSSGPPAPARPPP